MSAISRQFGTRPRPDDPPPLEAGDHLTATEFIRRYSRDDAPSRAELIDGVVRLMSPITYTHHANPHGNLIGWLSFYAALTPGVELAAPSSMRLDEGNVPEPDALLRIPSGSGGQSRISPGGYLEGAPELVAEVAGSSVSFDLHEKLDVYRRHGVREYVVWRSRDQAIDWFALHGGQYRPLAPDEDGLFKSEIYPGLWLDAAALIRGDLAAVFAIVSRGTAAASGHAALVTRLRTT